MHQPELHLAPSTTIAVRVGDTAIGAPDAVTAIAGPCAVESYDSLRATAAPLHAMGVRILRAGAFKPRTSPRSFQGLGREGLEILAAVGAELGMAVVTEVLDTADVDLVAQHAHMLQIGTRNMANYRLLEAAARAGLPILLKRGMGATVDELLAAADYILAAGNEQVVLCERGIRSFETATRATLDINAVPLLKLRTQLPVIVDPSHSTGMRELVEPVALAAVAAGADGVIVETHHAPDSAVCDAVQTIALDAMEHLLDRACAVAAAIGRRLELAPATARSEAVVA